MKGSKINGKYIQLLKMHQPKENLFQSCVMSCEITSPSLNLQFQWQVTELRISHVTKHLLCKALNSHLGQSQSKALSLSLLHSVCHRCKVSHWGEVRFQGSQQLSIFSSHSVDSSLDFLNDQDGEEERSFRITVKCHQVYLSFKPAYRVTTGN